MNKDTGEIVAGFGVRKTYEGQKDFDQTYKEVVIKKRIKRIGEGDEDFIIEEYEEIKETPIQQVLDAQAGDAGIEAFMKPYIMSGTEPEFVGFDDINKAPIQDFTKFPDDPLLSQDVYADMMSAWNSLDPELKGSAKTPEEFVNTLTKEKFLAYLKSKVLKKENVEKGNVENGK